MNYLRTFSKEESVLSLVCGVLSVIFLFVAFLIYTCNPKLQNIPGKNLISLISALLMAQLLFILAPLFTNSSPWCAVIAIIIHYSFLSSFFWMNVMSFDIFFTFSAGFKRSGDRGQSSKRFKYYSLYAWSVPCVLLTICVIIDVWSTSDYRPLYGDVVCWISSPKALLVFFLVPLGIILFSNIIFFVITAKNIYVSEHNTAKILKKKESCKLLIYIKLSVAMGMTWIFGFVATGANNIVWWYLFIIFNGLQGVFIFMSFVLTPKVLRMVHGRVRTIFIDYRSYSMFGKSSSSTKSTHLMTTKSEDILVKQDESKC
ncbi:hypothetical protein FSP39_012296 [Pinctada imbricata]|uniref:G-protein coupled receptors family 2 profile 2 domain-containing protein n=1 Tax=Pinctada imbricata TaxID=66713 RepID=A0AA88Y6R4_PINIB|nr:hypothetical protein FSP39_012296 [Pinctada imbricata]